MTLFDRLMEYSSSGALPMHMPGHKRNAARFPWLDAMGCRLDITEIEGFDNLNDPQSIFRDLERRAAALWGSEESIALVGGSTLGILAAIRGQLRQGERLLMARGSHLSVYHAAEIARAGTSYIVPEIDPSLGIWRGVDPRGVELALASFPDIRLVAVTSPTYEGVISDISAIAEICHTHGVPLLVDEAHGAHLGFGGFPEGAVRQGADIVVHSLHKTLPSLTQTAILHMSGTLARKGEIRRNAALFQSSSPSYLLSASIDGCVDYMEREGGSAAADWLKALGRFRVSMERLEKLSVAGGDLVSDPSKILISCAGADISGRELMDLLRADSSVELEMAAEPYALAMTGLGDTEETIRSLGEALLTADAQVGLRKGAAHCGRISLPEKRLEIWQAIGEEKVRLELPNACGRVSGEYLWEYPPGAPIIVPGETVDEEVILRVRNAGSVHSDSGEAPDGIFCIAGY